MDVNTRRTWSTVRMFLTRSQSAMALITSDMTHMVR